MKRLKTTSQLLPLILLSFLFLASSCKKDKDDDPDPGQSTEKVLVIENGARSINPDESENYSAIWVKTDGSVSPATGVSWSVDDGNVASISSSGALTVAGTGSSIVKASVTDGGISYAAQVPIAISLPSLLAVAPSAIIYERGGSLQMETIYLGTANPTFSFSSSDASVASVNASGVVTFNGTGSCTISVTASNIPNQPFTVPVLVVGPPVIALPVTRVEVNPASASLFRGETQQLNAETFNLDGATSANVTWSSSNPDIASVNGSGLVTANNLGEVAIYATAQGITGSAEIFVSPDTIIEVSPFVAGIPAGGSLQFTAKAYNLRTNSYLPNVTNFVWEAPTYGFPAFDFVSVNQSGLVTIDNNAFPGNLSFIYVYLSNNQDAGGVASIKVSICDCGPGNSDVTQINIANSSPISLSLFSGGMAQLNAAALDASGNAVANPELRYCSDDMAIASIDEMTGEIVASGPGSTTLRVCSGGFAEATIAVDVTL